MNKNVLIVYISVGLIHSDFRLGDNQCEEAHEQGSLTCCQHFSFACHCLWALYIQPLKRKVLKKLLLFGLILITAYMQRESTNKLATTVKNLRAGTRQFQSLKSALVMYHANGRKGVVNATWTLKFVV